MASKVKSTTKFGIPWTGRKTGMLESFAGIIPKITSLDLIFAYFPFLFPPVKENPTPMEPDGGRDTRIQAPIYKMPGRSK